MEILANKQMITSAPPAPAASYFYNASQKLFHTAATSGSEGRSLLVVVAKRVAYLVAGYILLIVSPIEVLGRGGSALLYRLITLRFSGQTTTLTAYFIEALHLGKLVLITPVLLFLSIFSFHRFICYVDHLTPVSPQEPLQVERQKTFPVDDDDPLLGKATEVAPTSPVKQGDEVGLRGAIRDRQNPQIGQEEEIPPQVTRVEQIGEILPRDDIAPSSEEGEGEEIENDEAGASLSGAPGGPQSKTVEVERRDADPLPETPAVQPPASAPLEFVSPLPPPPPVQPAVVPQPNPKEKGQGLLAKLGGAFTRKKR